MAERAITDILDSIQEQVVLYCDRVENWQQPEMLRIVNHVNEARAKLGEICLELRNV